MHRRYYLGQVIAQVELVASQDVELSTFLKVINAVKGFFSLTVVKIIILALFLCAVGYVAAVINSSNRKKARRRAREQENDEE